MSGPSPALDEMGLRRLACTAPSVLWTPAAPDRLLVCGEGIEAGMGALPAGVDPFELTGFSVVRAGSGDGLLLSAALRGGGFMAPLDSGGDPGALLSHGLRVTLDPLPEQGRLWLVGLVAGEVEDSAGMPRLARELLWGDRDGRPRAWSEVRPHGARLRDASASRDGFWFHHPAGGGEHERRLVLERSSCRVWITVGPTAPDPQPVLSLAAVARDLLGEEV